MGTPYPSLEKLPVGLSGLNELQTSVLLLVHGDAND